jgi:nucleoid-associated protein YgaU
LPNESIINGAHRGKQCDHRQPLKEENMSHVQPKPNWETRLGLGLIGGLLAILGFVAWQKIDSLLDSSTLGEGETVAEATDPAPQERPVGKRPEERKPFVARPGSIQSEMSAPTENAFGDAPAQIVEVSPSPARIIGLREAPPIESPPQEVFESPPAFDERESFEPWAPSAEHAGHVDEAPRSEGIVTEEGDSFWRIAERAYGDGAWYKALYAHNRERFPFPDRVAAGGAIDAPAIETLRELYPEHCPEPRKASPPIARLAAETPAVDNHDARVADTISRQGYTESQPVDRFGGRTHVVSEGETLSQIAHEALGDRSRWTEIYRLNRARLGDQFETPRAGLVLVLPEKTRIAGGNSFPPDSTSRSDQRR